MMVRRDTHPDYLPNKHKPQQYRFQSHAFEDCLRGLEGLSADDAEHGISPNKKWQKLLCPLCLQFFPLADLDYEHAPQKGGQSRFGGEHIRLLDCRSCNQKPGKTYEAKAHEIRKSYEHPQGQSGEILERGVPWKFKGTDLDAPTSVDYLALDLTDLKTAYLIAFTSLGHSWIITPRLNQIRSAIRTGVVTDDWLMGVLDRPVDGIIEQRQVIEFGEPFPHVMVTGDGVFVVLPCDGSPDQFRERVKSVYKKSVLLPDMGKTITRRSIPWPHSTEGPGATPEKTWDNSHFFTLDRCNDDTHTHASRASSESIRRMLDDETA